MIECCHWWLNFPTSSSLAISCGTSIAGTDSTGAGGSMNVVGADAVTDAAAAACAAITSLLMRSRYISCHALSNGSMAAMSTIKILDFRVILANENCVVSFVAFIAAA
jgi:hypothetical protein